MQIISYLITGILVGLMDYFLFEKSKGAVFIYKSYEKFKNYLCKIKI